MKKILGLILVFALGLLLIGCKENPTLNFDQSSISVEVGQEFELQPKIENLEGNDLVNYSFDVTGVIESKGGNKFIAVKVGNVKISASLKDYEDVKCDVNVTVTEPSVKVSGITITGINTMAVGHEQSLTAEVLPTDALNKELDWSSSDETVASVNNGLVKALKEGTVTIKATSKDGSNVEGSFEITVGPAEVKPNSITVKGNNEMKVGEEQTLTIEVEPENASKNVVWESSDNSVATVNNGLVVALQPGKVVIKATGLGNVSTEFEITVKEDIIDPKELKNELVTLLNSYLNSEKGSLKIEYVDNENVLVENYGFELKGEDSFTKLADVFSTSTNASVYIKDEMIYMNANGTLGKYPIDDSEIQDIFDNHSVATILNPITSFYKEEAFFNSLTLSEQVDDKLVFDLDILNYKGNKVNTLNIDSIQLIVTINNDKITTVEYQAVSGDNVSKVIVTYLGLDFLIEFPNDLDSYPDA